MEFMQIHFYGTNNCFTENASKMCTIKFCYKITPQNDDMKLERKWQSLSIQITIKEDIKSFLSTPHLGHRRHCRAEKPFFLSLSEFLFLFIFLSVDHHCFYMKWRRIKFSFYTFRVFTLRKKKVKLLRTVNVWLRKCE